ncbi:MAG: hypothetical protein HC828_04040 [Blastochloris sp.]|nr:hypothetical protein [Blastochloris sp.]
MRPDRLIAQPADWGPGQLDRTRRGILYVLTDNQVAAGRELLSQTRLTFGMAAMGPELFFGREDGPWIDWDPHSRDQNSPGSELMVCDRPWPYCWGDALWLAGVWDEQPVYLHLRTTGRWVLAQHDLPDWAPRHEAEELIHVAIGSPFNTSSLAELTAWIEQEASTMTEQHARLLTRQQLAQFAARKLP